MNTANLLNINVENNSAKSGKPSGLKLGIDNNQGNSGDSNTDSNESKQVSGFENALKESMTKTPDGQNSDRPSEQAKEHTVNENLPEDGKQLPMTEAASSAPNNSKFVDAINQATVNQATDNQTTINQESQTKNGLLIANNQSEINLAQAVLVDGQENDSSIKLSSATTENESPVDSFTNQSTISSDKTSDKDISTEVIDSAKATEFSSINSISTEATNTTQNQNAVFVDGNPVAQNNSDLNSIDLSNKEQNTTLDQLNFIEQAQNTTTSVGVNTSAIKDVFQNLNAGGNNTQKLAGQNTEQNFNEPLSVLQRSDSKGGSLFDGSMQDSSGRQQGFSQNTTPQPNANWMGAVDNVQPLTETQAKLLDTENLVIDEKVDTTKVSKAVSETIKPTQNNETLARTGEFTVKTPVASKGWSDEFNNHISYVAKNGGGNAKIKLNPLNLGPVEASIKIASEGGVTVQITANQATTRDALDLGVARLKEMLEEQGFSQVDVNVSDQGLSKGNRESTTTAASAANHSKEGDLDGADEEIHESASVKSTINGVVDYYA